MNLTAAAIAASVFSALTSTAAYTALPADVPNAPTGKIEKKFYADGEWAVSHHPSYACCDSAGYAYDVYAPSDPGQGGFRHPIVTFGNGTSAQPYNYDYLLRHLASWGFVVVATRQPNTGSGREILDAAQFMVDENKRPGSPFKGHLNVKRVGAMGHSQGASGVINAMRDSDGLIRTAIAMALPSQSLCSDDITCANTRELTDGSLFLLNGSLDVLISPSRQPKWQKGLQSNSAYYRATDDHLPKFWATLRGANHNDMMGQPDCKAVGITCGNGVYGYLGYPTAWLMDQLQDDAEAHSVFVRDGGKGTGEIFEQDKNWSNQTSNIED